MRKSPQLYYFERTWGTFLDYRKINKKLTVGSPKAFWDHVLNIWDQRSSIKPPPSPIPAILSIKDITRRILKP